MPLRIRWSSKEYMGIALMLLGACGLFQVVFIIFAMYFLSVGNYVTIILIPIGVTLALYYASIITFESFAQVERRERLRSQFRKVKVKNKSLRKILDFPIIKPLLIIFVIFTIFFIITYSISIFFLDNVNSFLLTEVISALICLLVANYFEKAYARVKRI